METRTIDEQQKVVLLILASYKMNDLTKRSLARDTSGSDSL